MAKKPQTPGKALGGGKSCFNPDGTYTKNGCDALRLAAKKLAAATSKIQSITEDRDAWLKDYPTLKGKEREQRAVQIVDAITGLKQYLAPRSSSMAAPWAGSSPGWTPASSTRR
jgi:hypothetical protein